MFSTFLIISVVFLVLVVWRRQDFMRITTVVGAQIGKLTNMFWSYDTVAVMQDEINQAQLDIANATEQVASYKGDIINLERYTTKLKQDEAVLLARIKVAVNNKDDERAADHALHLLQVRDKLVKTKEKLDSHNEPYQNNLKKLEAAYKLQANRRERPAELKVELKLSKIDAQLAETTQKLNINLNNPINDRFAELEAELERQIDQNKGKEQVALDLSKEGLAEIQEQEEIQKAKALAILTQVKADIGIK